MATISDMLAQGQRYQRTGDNSRAEQISRQILEADPCNAKALHLLSASLRVLGRLSEAAGQYQKALSSNPTRADLHNDLGIVLAMTGRLSEAVAAFQRVLDLEPNDADAHNNLGNALRIQGRVQEAIAHFREAIRLKPNHAGAHHNLAIALLHQGQPAQAIASIQETLRQQPYNAEALASLQRALQLNPNFVEARNLLGNTLAGMGRFDEAVAAYRQTLGLKPDFAEAHSNLGIVLCRQGLLDEGAASFEQALRLRPDYANAHNNLGNVRKDQGRLDESITSLQRAVDLEPEKYVYRSSLLGTLNYLPRYNAHAILDAHHAWEMAHARLFEFTSRTFRNDPSPGRRLRIGYVSPDFRDHVVGRNVWPLLRNHDHEQFEITLYANLGRTDAMSEQFRQCADNWCGIADWPDDQVASRVQQDGIDVLVDLALHTAGNRLLVFARKPSPVQVTFAGYPGTTGLRAIDYRLTDPYLDPPNLNEACYAEESYRLPHTFWCYDPQTDEPAVAPLPALERGFITFGCLNNFCKINDDVLELWAQVLRAVQRSRLLLLGKQGSHRQRTLDFFAERGISGERVDFYSPRPRPEYLALYHQMDIGLDTFPYNGHTTSLDSFWMGVPVITLVGQTVVGRAGLSQLTNLGSRELAASTPDEFVRLATELASDLTRLDILRRGLRDRMRQSPLMDAVGFARGIEQAYRSMWRSWCAQQHR